MPRIRAAHALLTAVAFGFALGVTLPAASQSRAPGNIQQALLAVEEAELRERIMTTLAVAESVRLRGRTILVAMSEIGRVRRRLEKIDPTSPNRAAFEERLRKVEQRRVELDREVDEEFLSYLELVSEIAGEVWTRVDRVGDELSAGLAERRLAQLVKLYPVVRSHIQEFNQAETVTRAITDRWRREVDDTYEMRQQRLRAAPPPEPSLANPVETEEDI
ncbi:MAG: hypothetical protein ACFBRM_02395 [Pikeienuella sp.]